MLARDLDGVVALMSDLAALRASTAETVASIEALPGQRDRIAHAVGEARQALEVAEAEAASAAARLERLERERRPRQEELALARSEAHTAGQAVSDARTRLERLDSERSSLERQAGELIAARTALEERAQAFAGVLLTAVRIPAAGTPPPPADATEIDAWGSHARAVLFVARGTLQTERERIVAEADALAVAVLGENPPGLNVELVRRRLAEALT